MVLFTPHQKARRHHVTTEEIQSLIKAINDPHAISEREYVVMSVGGRDLERDAEQEQITCRVLFLRGGGGNLWCKAWQYPTLFRIQDAAYMCEKLEAAGSFCTLLPVCHLDMIPKTTEVQDYNPQAGDRFDNRCVTAMRLANREAQRSGCEHIGTDHILLGLRSEGSGVAAHVLKMLDISLSALRDNLHDKFRQLPECRDQIKQAIEMAMKESNESWSGEGPSPVRSHGVSTEHLLLGITGHPSFEASILLSRLNIAPQTIHAKIKALLS
jgi:hypothetical protein